MSHTDTAENAKNCECTTWVDRVFPNSLYSRDDELIVAWDGGTPSFVEIYGATGWHTVTARGVNDAAPQAMVSGTHRRNARVLALMQGDGLCDGEWVEFEYMPNQWHKFWCRWHALRAWCFKGVGAPIRDKATLAIIRKGVEAYLEGGE